MNIPEDPILREICRNAEADYAILFLVDKGTGGRIAQHYGQGPTNAKSADKLSGAFIADYNNGIVYPIGDESKKDKEIHQLREQIAGCEAAHRQCDVTLQEYDDRMIAVMEKLATFAGFSHFGKSLEECAMATCAEITRMRGQTSIEAQFKSSPFCARHQVESPAPRPGFRSDWIFGCERCEIERLRFKIQEIQRTAGHESTSEICAKLRRVDEKEKENHALRLNIEQIAAERNTAKATLAGVLPDYNSGFARVNRAMEELSKMATLEPPGGSIEECVAAVGKLIAVLCAEIEGSTQKTMELEFIVESLRNKLKAAEDIVTARTEESERQKGLVGDLVKKCDQLSGNVDNISSQRDRIMEKVASARKELAGISKVDPDFLSLEETVRLTSEFMAGLYAQIKELKKHRDELITQVNAEKEGKQEIVRELHKAMGIDERPDLGVRDNAINATMAIRGIILKRSIVIEELNNLRADYKATIGVIAEVNRELKFTDSLEAYARAAIEWLKRTWPK